MQQQEEVCSLQQRLFSMSMGRAFMDSGLSYRCTFHTILLMLSNDAHVEVCHHLSHQDIFVFRDLEMWGPGLPS